MEIEDIYSGFEKGRIEEYRREVIERWGEDTLLCSEECVSGWSAEERLWVQQESEAINRGMVERIGRAPDDAEVQELMERYFAYMQRFFDCSPEVFRQIGRGYVDDKRFTAFYDRYHPYLARFMRDAMAVYAERHGAGTECG